MSLERERFLAILLDCLSPLLQGSDLFVDVAPSPRTSPLYAGLRPQRYLRLDFDPAADGRPVDVRASVTHFPLPDGEVDLMVCYHVLEHVPEDALAMREIARVLAPGGVALVQVPWRPREPTDEDPSAGREERIRRFGQADHVRFYGSDFEARLTSAGLLSRRVTPSDLLGAEACAWMRLNPGEAVWLLRSAGDGDGAADLVEPLGALSHAITAALETAASAKEAVAASERDRAEAVAAAAESRRREQVQRERALRWKARAQEVSGHWVMKGYRRLRKPAARLLHRD